MYIDDARDVNDYKEFFGLPKHFSGTKEVKREGLLFRVTVLKNNVMKLGVISDHKGILSKTIVVSDKEPTFDREYKEQTRYSVLCKEKPGAPESHSLSFTSLDKAIEYLREYAEPNSKTKIYCNTDVTIRYDVYIPSKKTLKIEYGNSEEGKVAANDKQNKDQPSKASVDSVKANSDKSVATAEKTQSSTQMNTPENPAVEGTEKSADETTVQAESANAPAETGQSEPKKKNTTVFVCSVVGAVLVIGAAGAGIYFAVQKKKHKKEITK